MSVVNTIVGSQEDIIVYRGVDWLLNDLEFYTDSTKVTPLDVSSDTFEMNVIQGDKKTRPVITFDNTSGFSFPATNKLRRSKLKAETNIRAGVYTYDLKWTDSRDGKTYPIRYGRFKIKDDKSI